MEPDYDKLVRQLSAALDKAEKFPVFSQLPEQKQIQKFEVNMGGGSIAVWLCATFCLLSLLSIYYLSRDIDHIASEVSEIKQNDRDQMHQMNAIYQYAPNLRPKDKP